MLMDTGNRSYEEDQTVKKTLLLVIGITFVSVLLAALYRSANNAELPDDEWFEFENLPT